MKTYKLNNGVEIPSLGLGTWLIDNDKIVETVKTALDIGYRLIDTAEAYGNEEGIGKALDQTSVPREEIFVTTKIAAEYKTYGEVANALNESLDNLGLDYIDLMLIHSPQPWTNFRESENRFFKENLDVWKALEDAYDAGKVRAIGFSNFKKDDIENILNNCRIKPMVNQILTHVGNTPVDLIDFCNENNIQVEAYAPIAHGVSENIPEAKQIADKYGVSVQDVCLKYVDSLNLVSLPKASSYEHLKDNYEFDFNLSDDDLEYLRNAKPLKDYGEDSGFPVFNKSRSNFE